MDSADALAEGSPIDRAAFSALILWGIIVLSRRKINWGRLLLQNKWIALYLLYCLSSIAWTDEPFLIAKRWLKDLGTPIMALVLLTEPERRPYEAVGITLRRLAFLFLPLSVLYVKYYPTLGRAYHVDGSPMYTGIGHQKNDLGLMCLLSGLYFSGKMLATRNQIEAKHKNDIYDYLLMGMLLWLLLKSDSQTSAVCLVTAVGLMVISRTGFISRKPSRIIALSALGALVYTILQQTIQIKDHILALLGRDPSLTNRTEIWSIVRRFEGNPIVGVGFMSFWTGDRMEAIWKACECRINQAHNGYLEQYLNLGYVGVGFIALIMISALFKVRKNIDSEPSAGVLRFCLLVVAALYNYTEASFYGISNVWLLLMVGCIDISGVVMAQVHTTQRPPESAALVRANADWQVQRKNALTGIGPPASRPPSMHRRTGRTD